MTPEDRIMELMTELHDEMQREFKRFLKPLDSVVLALGRKPNVGIREYKPMKLQCRKLHTDHVKI